MRSFEAARLEFDAYNADLEYTKASISNGNEMDSSKIEHIRALEGEVNSYREKYERLKSDVTIKLKFLDENRVKVMRKQLVLFQHAIYMYFAGNSQSLEGVMRQFKVLNVDSVESNRVDRNPDSVQPTAKLQSFLEKN